MNKKINLLIKIITIFLLLISVLVAILALNKNELGVVNIFEYSIIIPNENDKDKKIKSNDLVIAKEVGMSQLKKNTVIAYVDIEDNNSIQKVGTIKDIKITKSGAYIYSIDNKNIDSSCVIGKYVSNIKIVGKIIKVLLTRDGILLLIVTPLLLITIYRLFYFVNNISKK